MTAPIRRERDRWILQAMWDAYDKNGVPGVNAILDKLLIFAGNTGTRANQLKRYATDVITYRKEGRVIHD